MFTYLNVFVLQDVISNALKEVRYIKQKIEFEGFINWIFNGVDNIAQLSRSAK